MVMINTRQRILKNVSSVDHLAKECWSKNPKKDVQGTANEVIATAVAEKKTYLDENLLSKIGGEADNPDLWIADTGARVHMTP
jgi:hypothetical protein